MSTSPSPDKDPADALALAAQRGDSVALTALCTHLGPHVLVWARHHVSGVLRNLCEAEDIAQETWQRVLTALPSFDASRFPFRAWLFGIAKNVVLHQLRRAGRGERVQAAAGDSSAIRHLEQQPDPITSLTQRMARNDELRQLQAAVDSLPPDDRQLVILLGIEGLRCTEVGGRLGANPEAIGKRWQRLRERLRLHPVLARLQI